MTLTVGDVMRWDPGAVTQVAEAARSRGRISTDTAERLPTFPDWTGPCSEQAKAAIERTRQTLRSDAAAASAAARSADAAARNVAIVKDNLAQVLDAAREFEMVLDPVSGTVHPGPGSLGRLEDFRNVAVLQKAIRQVLAQADEVDRVLAAAMDAADDVVEVPSEARPIPLPPPGADALQVEDWWKSLSQRDRERLITQHPAEVGKLNGVPAAARDAINRQVMHDDLDRVLDTAAQQGISADDVLADAGRCGLTAEDVARYRNAVKARKGLDHQAGPDMDRPLPVMLWKYEPLAPLSDDETMAQVVGPAKEFVQANQLQDVTCGFAFASCNDQGEPSYRGNGGHVVRASRRYRRHDVRQADRVDDDRTRLARRAAVRTKPVRHRHPH